MSLKGTVWAPIGPSPISQGGSTVNGLVSAITVSPSNSNLIYIGTIGGGVWRSDDGGVSWVPLFDRQLSLGIGDPGALALDSNNTDVVYVGTSSRFVVHPEAGLFKSTDGGASWVQLGSGYPTSNTGNATQFINQSINVIIVDPANSNIVYLASDAGCFRSTDGGLNWTQGANSNGDVRSLVLDTSSPAATRILYAGISGRGIFRSNDGGRNWTNILNATTAVVAAAIGPAPNSFNKSIIAIAPPTNPPNPGGVQVLYATLEGTGGAPDPVGIFMSTDQGTTWTQRTAAGMPSGTQGGYSFHMAVDPASPGDGANDIIYLGAVGHARSTDSGNSFAGMSGLHADNHAWCFFPQTSPTPSIVFCGNDGGLYRSINNGATWIPLSSGKLQVGLLYNIDMKPDATGSVTVGALQDNGLQTTGGVVVPNWSSPQGGDGWDAAYDGVTAGRVYGTSGFWPAPCTRVFVSNADGTDFPPTVPSGQEITPWGTTSDQNCGLFPIATDPSTAGIVYVSGNQNLWQSRDGGGSWRIVTAVTNTANDINVARTNGNNIIFAVGTQVFVSTNALAATVGGPTGVTFTNITRNLPGRFVARVAFDPNDPSMIYAVLGGFNTPGNTGHVFRTSIAATTWTDISPSLNVPFNAIALDGTDNPTTIYAGTDFGVIRSVDGGGSWSILDDIHFPRVPVFDLVLKNGMLRAATYGRGAFEFIFPEGPSIAVNLENNLEFGTVCEGPQFLALEIYNVGKTDLVINSVQRLMGSTSFSVLTTPGTPLVIAPGDHVGFCVRYDPTVAGPLETATIRIVSNDPDAPVVDVSATGVRGSSRMSTAIADGGDFGDVCVGERSDMYLTVNNSGVCSLELLNINSSSAEFVVPAVFFFPLVINAGNSLALPIRFQPTSFGSKTASITLLSNDPTSPRVVRVSGNAPAPELDIIFANTGDYGSVCIGSFVDKPLTLLNSGPCTLTINSITSSASEFVLPSVIAYPLRIAPGTALEVPIRFAPASFGVKSGTITITSDDPAGPKSVNVFGDVPSGKLVVTGSTCIGGVKACCVGERTITISNAGDCDLHVTSVALSRRHKHWRLINNPFPATLHSGASLSVLIRYKATEKCPKCCELVITSDDPLIPVKRLDLQAYTVWNDCGCRKCCDDCQKGSCEKRHDECCTAQGLDACCFDEGDEHQHYEDDD